MSSSSSLVSSTTDLGFFAFALIYKVVLVMFHKIRNLFCVIC